MYNLKKIHTHTHTHTEENQHFPLILQVEEIRGKLGIVKISLPALHIPHVKTHQKGSRVQGRRRALTSCSPVTAFYNKLVI